MSAFDKVIGYEAIKTELLQICDLIRNREVYEALGAKAPKGILLYGDPGLGKSLMASCFIEESGLHAFVLRRNQGKDNFVRKITETFRKAKEEAPCIVFLDDMDKFSNEDAKHQDTAEYVAVQAGIDDVKDLDVFVIATANEVYKFPNSLIRIGRFDKKIEVESPSDQDACAIIKHYLAGKKVSDSINMDDLTKMISYSSCAKLESILNEAALQAAYLVVSEALNPGSVGLASLRCECGALNGFIHRCSGIQSREDHVLIALAGKAAVELYYADYYTAGCNDDLRKAYRCIRDLMGEEASHGFGMLDVSATRSYGDTSENLNSRNEAVVQAALERFMAATRRILLDNRPFLAAVTTALAEKKTLLHSDIQKIREFSMKEAA